MYSVLYVAPRFRLQVVELVVVVIVVMSVSPRQVAPLEKCAAVPQLTSILFQSLFLGSSILEPDLDDSHVESCFEAQLLADVSCRLLAVDVDTLERLLLCLSDCGSRPLR